LNPLVKTGTIIIEKDRQNPADIPCPAGGGAKNKRLDVLNHSNDGFFIANEDLKLRGPGDLFGIRQSGDLDFGLGDIYQDSDVLMLAGELADQVLSGDVVLPEKEFGLFEKSIDYRTI